MAAQTEPRISVSDATHVNGKPPELSCAKQLKMVGWYDPLQLARTGIEVAISTIFGRHSDYRLVEALASGKEEIYDYTCYYNDNGKDSCEPDTSRKREEIWIDYVGDVGDGWNPTYAIAYYLTEAKRKFRYQDPQTGKEAEAETHKGDILIFGGDEVYPTASRKEYQQRLLAPYETALRYTTPPYPHAFAIPGNHDWYDSLVAFTRLFTSRRWFGGWRTQQTRSYFALKLPHNWWLLGTDVQLGSDIDGPQVRYFENVAKQMDEESRQSGEEARIILCHAEPHWLYAAKYADLDPNYSENNLGLLEKKLGKKVAVFIAGDLHHYRRHEATDQSSTQKITAGGGGAFLHPTHNGLLGNSLAQITERESGRVFKQEMCYPSEEVSSGLCWRNLFFPYLKNNASWTFGFVTAFLYWLTTLSILARIDELGMKELEYEFGSITATALHSVINSPLTMFWVIVTLLGFIFFTDTHSKNYRFIMGSLHALAHILTAFAIALISVSFVAKVTPESWRWLWHWGGYDFHPDLRLVLASLLIMLGGFVFGSLIMGLYLLISLNLFGRHANEAFSSLAIEDWKHFLRLHIDEQGTLTIYPIGIKRVPRKWKARRRDESGPEMLPDGPNATGPELIEPPIVLKAAETATGVTISSPNWKLQDRI